MRGLPVRDFFQFRGELDEFFPNRFLLRFEAIALPVAIENLLLQALQEVLDEGELCLDTGKSLVGGNGIHKYSIQRISER